MDVAILAHSSYRGKYGKKIKKKNFLPQIFFTREAQSRDLGQLWGSISPAMVIVGTKSYTIINAHVPLSRYLKKKLKKIIVRCPYKDFFGHRFRKKKQFNFWTPYNNPSKNCRSVFWGHFWISFREKKVCADWSPTFWDMGQNV